MLSLLSLLTPALANPVAPAPAADAAPTHEEAPTSSAKVSKGSGTLLTFLPHGLPLGAQARLHLPMGRYAALHFGAGAAVAVFDTASGETPVRARVEVGFDHYFGERYDSLFLGPRAQFSYWTAPPAVIGGTNFSGGLVLGRRFGLDDHGTTLGIGGGVLVKKYYETQFDFGDGIQPLPTFEIDISLPKRRG